MSAGALSARATAASQLTIRPEATPSGDVASGIGSRLMSGGSCGL